MGQDVCLISSKDQSQLLLMYLLNSAVGMSQVASIMVGATLKRINVGQIKELLVVCPPPYEQMVLAAHLDRETARIDALVGKVREAIDKLKEYRSALITAAVTGHQIDVGRVPSE